MRSTITLFSLVLLLVSCNSVKRNQKFLARGNYDQAIELAVKKLQKDKNGKKSREHIAILEEAFKKAVAEDTRRISFLKKSNAVEAPRELFYTYATLEARQQLIRPLLPLKNASFTLVDYTDEIIAAKKDFADHLFEEGNRYLSRNTIMDARTAYHYFEELEEIQPNYLNLVDRMEEARFQGTDFVFVTINNRSNQVIPRRLERDLLDFDTYGLDDFWTQYHAERQRDIPYNFGIALNFRQINISPERVSEKEFNRKKRIKDGWEYQLDRNGNVMKDSLGNDIKVDRYIDVTARVTYTEQTKGVQVGGNVIYRDLLGRRDIGKYPLQTEFVFENIFARFRGDERALTKEDRALLKNRFVPFPPNEQMVFDAGEDIKLHLKAILKDNSFR
ncbi:MAG: hypothetical protein MK211_11940 [Flavobacteriales bacterium]|jgi:hypothetical protein|nr:hypothetical protein [Flavobacteriales bacterium]